MLLLRRLFPMNPVTYFVGLATWMITGCFLHPLHKGRFLPAGVPSLIPLPFNQLESGLAEPLHW